MQQVNRVESFLQRSYYIKISRTFLAKDIPIHKYRRELLVSKYDSHNTHSFFDKGTVTAYS